MMDVDSNLIMPVTMVDGTAGDLDAAKNNQLVQPPSFRDTLLEVCPYAQQAQVTVDAPVDPMADGVATVESQQVANDLYAPWMHVSG
ncbi:hypothetical protein V6N13_053653 [Hibiscus sabdariffa]